MRQNRLFICCALVLALSSCQKMDNPAEEQRSAPEYDDAVFFLDGLVKKTGGEYIPIQGFISEGSISIPVSSIFEAERHFRSLLPPGASVQEGWQTLVWYPDDENGVPQGEVVFRFESEGPAMARVSLPASFPEMIRTVLYQPSTSLLRAVDPAVQEDLEDNYYYGAIVNISDHGCGSGKFVVFREYDFSNGAPGMAVRLDSHHWDTGELNQKDNAARVFARASCLSTMEKAGEIYRKDRSILSKQLRNAGCTIIDQHYASSSSSWNGWHYYYCLHDGESSWIGPVHDTDFYECWIYWFRPEGNSILFW